MQNDNTQKLVRHPVLWVLVGGMIGFSCSGESMPNPWAAPKPAPPASVVQPADALRPAGVIHGRYEFTLIGNPAKIARTLELMEKFRPLRVASHVVAKERGVTEVALYGERAGIDKIVARIEAATLLTGEMSDVESVIMMGTRDETDEKPRPQITEITGSPTDPDGQVAVR